MKRTIFLFAFIMFTGIVLGQNDSSSYKSTLNDTTLNRIYSMLPKGWVVYEGQNQIVIQRTDSVYILEEYRFDDKHQGETKAERNERIMKEGKKGVSRIILKYENRWGYTKLVTSKNNNTYYNQKLQKLPGKYGITTLYDKELSTKQKPVYTGTTEKEKESIKKFDKDYADLYSKITILPNYHSEKYSLFLVSTEGCNDDNHYVITEEASLELYKILALFFEFGK